ncbi:hypothetical protein LAZ67_22001295 [Cordylochernes scorpioides]|uniref:Peptidase aspartic putative domain-containing protein n=1 Tax=Cordylochernes scorpioides TaxID=51811 RepID=A0ABY6LQQ4_9ARAC|nr:hypothetical protein LAZ67_22001295 [Cordylochernes scorpioides]
MLDEPRCQLYRAVVVEGDTAGPKCLVRVCGASKLSDAEVEFQSTCTQGRPFGRRGMDDNHVAKPTRSVGHLLERLVQEWIYLIQHLEPPGTDDMDLMNCADLYGHHGAQETEAGLDGNSKKVEADHGRRQVEPRAPRMPTSRIGPGREEKAVPIFGTLLDQKMEREEALERLKKKRTILRTSLSKYGKRIKEYDVHKECDHEELLGQLSDVYEELRRVDEEIGKLIDIKDLEKDLKMVEEYREKAVAWKYLLKKRSLVVAEGMQRETATATKKEYPGKIGRPTLTGMVKLPKLTMERFYREISQWLNFWNAFDSSINRNEHLTKIDKFNYLKAYLGGTAAQTVEGFCLSEENYDKAVELLKKRFGKGERLIDVHMNNLLALKPLRVTKDVRAFRELYGRILVQIRSLEKNQNATPARGMMRDETLTNLTTPVVLLPTLRVTIRGKCKERLGRILIDTGSQRLSNLDGSYGCNFEALSQDVICDSVPRVHQGKWMQDLSAHDIELTDLHRGPLEILIGADIAGKLLTGEHRRLPSGLVAVQTRLGWTLMGKFPATEEETSSEIGVSSDIEKAFLQIGIREEDRDYLRLLWYDKEGNVMVLRHARVVFGITTSPYLLLATLFHHLNKAPEHWQETAELLRESLYIDNCVASFSKVTDMEIFVDEAQRLASYATCIFLRIESEQEVTCQLVQARSRVAPLKGTTIPRLELLACLVGARLVNNVVRDLKFEDMERFYWTDSMNALHWIKGKDNWATFVMNRVMEIRSLSETEDCRFSGEIEVVGEPELVEKTKKRLAP